MLETRGNIPDVWPSSSSVLGRLPSRLVEARFVRHVFSCLPLQACWSCSCIVLVMPLHVVGLEIKVQNHRSLWVAVCIQLFSAPMPKSSSWFNSKSIGLVIQRPGFDSRTRSQLFICLPCRHSVHTYVCDIGKILTSSCLFKHVHQWSSNICCQSQIFLSLTVSSSPKPSL